MKGETKQDAEKELGGSEEKDGRKERDAEEENRLTKARNKNCN